MPKKKSFMAPIPGSSNIVFLSLLLILLNLRFWMLLVRSYMVNLLAHIEQRVCLWEGEKERERMRECVSKIFLVYEDNVRCSRESQLSGSLRSCHWSVWSGAALCRLHMWERTRTCVRERERVCGRRESEFAPLPRVAYAGRHLWLGAVRSRATDRYHD